MNKVDYLQAKEFIYSDIRREICLGKISNGIVGKNFLKLILGSSGGGNFIAALALLCYTEFAGKLITGKDDPAENFNLFFDKLGSAYKNFRKNHKVYNIFRCGLAHEYYVKGNCTIGMLKDKSICGISLKKDKYYFVVEKYFEDFKVAFDALEELFSKEENVAEHTNLAQRMATTLSVQKY